MIKNSQKQSGSAHVVIVVVIVVILIGALGFLFYQNIAGQDSTKKRADADVQTPKEDTDAPKDTRSTYVSSENNYSIRYSPDYKVLEKQENQGVTVYIAAKTLSDDEIYSRQNYKMHISVTPNTESAALLPQGDIGPGFREINDYEVDGVIGKQGIYPAFVDGQVSQTETDSIVTAVEYKGKIYRFESGSASMGNFDADDYNSMIESIDLL